MSHEQAIENLLIAELKLMGVEHDVLTPIRSKDGVHVYRVTSAEKSYIMKHFARPADRREIKNYEILNEIGIQTLRVFAHTKASLLIEDLTSDAQLRLASEADMSDTEVAAALARWYRSLHEKGVAYVQSYGDHLYDESDGLTATSLSLVKVKTKTSNLPFWTMLDTNLETMLQLNASLPRTLTYNDFFYTNMAVKHDKGEALMFDYNRLGKGFIEQDLRNVTCQLSDEAKSAFLDAYAFTPNRLEVLVCDLTSHLFTLTEAVKRKSFPLWAEESLQKLKDGTLENSLHALVRYNERSNI